MEKKQTKKIKFQKDKPVCSSPAPKASSHHLINENKETEKERELFLCEQSLQG